MKLILSFHATGLLGLENGIGFGGAVLREYVGDREYCSMKPEFFLFFSSEILSLIGLSRGLTEL